MHNILPDRLPTLKKEKMGISSQKGRIPHVSPLFQKKLPPPPTLGGTQQEKGARKDGDRRKVPLVCEQAIVSCLCGRAESDGRRVTGTHRLGRSPLVLRGKGSSFNFEGKAISGRNERNDRKGGEVIRALSTKSAKGLRYRLRRKGMSS